jgi:hypothetical protein
MTLVPEADEKGFVSATEQFSWLGWMRFRKVWANPRAFDVTSTSSERAAIEASASPRWPYHDNFSLSDLDE